MVEFSSEFFRDEVRCGFYIPTAIKQAWAAQLTILSEIDRICTKYGILWFADWGSLLGAVRHGGFIPWDDDLDIGMRREDYNRFRAVADEELPKEFVIHDYARQENHWLFLARVVNSSRISFDKPHLDQFHNYPYLSGVDIFIQDYIYRDPEMEKQRRDEVLRLLSLADGIVAHEISYEAQCRELEEVNRKYKTEIRPVEGSRTCREVGVDLYRLTEKQLARTPEYEADNMVQIFPWGLKGDAGLPKDVYQKTIRLPFEGTTICVPEDYLTVLYSRYGRDCMRAVKAWNGHDYPSFEGQHEKLRKLAGFEFQGFRWNPEMLNRPVPDTGGAKTGEILFLPIGAKEWESMRPYYEKHRNVPGEFCTVLPLPTLFKDVYGQITATDEEIIAASDTSEYPSDLPVDTWYDYDPAEHRPDRIYIQFPYDGANPCLTIPPLFYAENLRYCTPELIYVPAFPTDEFTSNDQRDMYNLRHYVTAPAVIYADRVIVQSENVRGHYIQALTAFAGEETGEIWKRRVEVQGEWAKSEEKEHSRKKILFCVSVSEFVHPSAGDKNDRISALRDRLGVLAKTLDMMDLELSIVPEDRRIWEDAGENAQQALEMLDAFAQEHHLVVRSYDKNRQMPDAHAYYGSPSPFVPLFTTAKKPVMIMDLEVESNK